MLAKIFYNKFDCDKIIMKEGKNMENNEKKNRKGLILLIVVVSIILLLVGYIIYDKITNNKENNNIIASNYKGIVNINVDDYNNTYSCTNACEEINNDVTFKTEWPAVDIIGVYNKRYILYKDGYYNVRIYDAEDKITYKFDFTIFNADDLNVDKNDKLLGILYYEKEEDEYDKVQYYSFVDGEKLDLRNYDYYYLRLLNNNYLTFNTFDEENLIRYAFVYDIRNKKIILKEQDNNTEDYIKRFEKLYDSDDYIILENMCQATCSDDSLKIYTSDLKLISDDFENVSLDENGNLIILKNNIIYTYDKEGNIIKETSSYNNILYISNSYVLDLNNNEIILYSNGNKLKTIAVLGIDEKYDYGYIGENIVDVFIKSSKVTLEDVWKDYSNFDSYTQYPFEAESKDDLKEWLKEYKCVNGYKYEYYFETKELKKFAVADCGEW